MILTTGLACSFAHPRQWIVDRRQLISKGFPAGMVGALHAGQVVTIALWMTAAWALSTTESAGIMLVPATPEGQL